MLTRSRSQRAERADDVLARTLGGVLKLDEEKVGVGFALVGLLVLREIIRADVTGIAFPDEVGPDNPKVPAVFTVCDAANQISDTDDVASSMGVHFGLFGDIPAGTGLGLANAPGPTSSFGPPSHGVRALIRDQRS